MPTLTSIDNIKIGLQYLIPKTMLSRLIGKLASMPLGIVTTTIIKWFIKRYHVNMQEALYEEAATYATFNDFFTRPLKPQMRPIDTDANILCHPVDGKVSQLGSIEQGSIFQAKGHRFDLQALVGGQAKDAESFQNGIFANIYLAPRDYHRIHMPIDGTLTKMIFVPGELFSVNPFTAANVPNLFARNERVIAFFDTAIGPMAMVLVGATIVASIETVWAGTVAPQQQQVAHWHYQSQPTTPVVLKKGEEMGRFKLGSTVILLFGANAVENFVDGLQANTQTTMGTPMAHIKTNVPNNFQSNTASRQPEAVLATN